jgi:hypothetical protein
MLVIDTEDDEYESARPVPAPEVEIWLAGTEAPVIISVMFAPKPSPDVVDADIRRASVVVTTSVVSPRFVKSTT